MAREIFKSSNRGSITIIPRWLLVFLRIVHSLEAALKTLRMTRWVDWRFGLILPCI